MAFWTAGGLGKDPKRNFRWRVTINGFNSQGANDASEATDSLVWWAKKVQKPNYTTAESKHVYLGHSFYWPGKTEWQEITLTLVDPVSPNATAILNKIVEDSGYQLPSTTKSVTQSKSKSVGALNSVVIEQLDAAGDPVETWTLKNPFIKKISFSDLDYENDELTTIDIGLRYDWATCQTGKFTTTPFFDANGPAS